MAVWRRKAIEAFPYLKRGLQDSDYTLYSLFNDLLPEIWEALAKKDDHSAAKIFAFAEWCARQKSKTLWNAVGVSFYEHLFDSSEALWPRLLEHMTPWAIQQHQSLWGEGGILPLDKSRRIMALIESAKNL